METMEFRIASVPSRMWLRQLGGQRCGSNHENNRRQRIERQRNAGRVDGILRVSCHGTAARKRSAGKGQQTPAHCKIGTLTQRPFVPGVVVSGKIAGRSGVLTVFASYHPKPEPVGPKYSTSRSQNIQMR